MYLPRNTAVVWHRAARLKVALAALPVLLACWGCNDPRGHISPQEAYVLERRAVDLLLRAAQSDDPILCCNALEALVKVAPDEGLPRFHAALRSPAAPIHFAALLALGNLRDRASLPVFHEDLNNPHPLVRLAAAYACCRLGETQPGATLVHALNDNPDEHVRLEAAHLIGLLGERQAVKRLRAALTIRANERSGVMRVEIYAALARLGDNDGLQRLMEHAQGDALARLSALQHLAELALPQSRDILRYHLDAKEDYLVPRLIAARGLGKLGSDEGYALALKNVQYSSKDAEDPDDAFRVRSNAALALGEIGEPRALPVLKQMAESDSDPRIQATACYAICRIAKRQVP